MLYKKFMMLSICVVFSCAGMERAQQVSIQSRPVAFSDVGLQMNQESFSGNNLAQRVAQLSITSSMLTKKCVRVDDFNQACEHMKALRRSLVPHENNLLTQGSNPRVLAAVDCVLAQAFTKLVEGHNRFNELEKPSSLSLADKKTLFIAQIISFKQYMNSLFASIDRNGSYYGDEPCIATKHVVTCDADGGMLAGIEALECFSQATDDTASLCDSCQHSPQELWCSDCKDSERGHSRVTPFIRTVAKEVAIRVGVSDALRYLESHVGATSVAIDSYASSENVPFVMQKELDHARTFADTRKTFLQIAFAQKEIIEGIAKMSDEQIRVETVLPLLENAPGSIGLAESAVRNTHSNNPLRFLPAQLFCKAALGSAAQDLDDAAKDLPAGKTLADLARLVREGAKTSLGISEKELPLLCQLTHILSQPLNLLIKDGVICLRESAADVDRFAALYKKPLRDQLLSPVCSKQFEQWAHAWKTGGIVAPPMSLSMITRSVLPSDSTIVRGTSKNIAPGILLGGNESYAAMLQKMKKKKEDEHPAGQSNAQ